MKRRSARLRQRLLGLVFVVGIVASIGLTVAIYDKQFTDVVMVTLRTDRVGNQLLPSSDVKIRGLTVGEVREITSDGDGAILQLALQPDKVDLLPSNSSARLLPKTLFGERFVALQEPADPARPLAEGDVIAQDRSSTAIEVERVLDGLLPLLQAVAPQDLSATLAALSQTLDGRGDQLGENLVQLDTYVSGLNTELGNLQADITGLADVSDTYTVAAPDLIDALADLTTTSRTVVEQRQDIDLLYATLTGTSQDLRGFLAANEDNLIRLAADSRETLELVARYSSVFGCTFQQLADFVPQVNEALGVDTATPGLRLNLEVVQDRGKYVPNRDEPELADFRGPVCYDIVPPDQGNFQLPEVPIQDGSVAPEQRAPGQASTLPAASAALGLPGSPGETDLVRSILAETTGTPAADVPGWSALVLAPSLRGNEVGLR